MHASLTLSPTSITSDGALNITANGTSTFDFGSSTLQMNTTNNGPFTLGNGLTTAGAFLVNNTSTFRGALLFAVASGTSLSVTNVTSGGTMYVTATTTLNAGLSQSGGVVTLASTTVNGITTMNAGIVTGDGTCPSDLAVIGTENSSTGAGFQACRNNTGTGPNQEASAIFYNGSAGYNVVTMSDNSSYLGGKQVDSYMGEGFFTRNDIVVSGHVNVVTGNPFNAIVEPPTTDPSMFEAYSDVNGPTMITTGNIGAPTTSSNPAFCIQQDHGASLYGTKYSLCFDGNGVLYWTAPSSNTIASSSSWDTTIGRAAPGIVKITNALQTGTSTLSNLPTCNSTNEGTMQAVTDSATSTWGATITGGGTSHVIGYCDGTNWTVAAK